MKIKLKEQQKKLCYVCMSVSEDTAGVLKIGNLCQQVSFSGKSRYWRLLLEIAVCLVLKDNDR